MSELRIDTSRMMAPRITAGVTDREWTELGMRFAEAHGRVSAAGKRFGFLELAQQRAENDRARAWARDARGRFDDIALLGIGGSALGATALHSALGGSAPGPRLHVLDNVDPATLSALLQRLKLDRTLWLVVSKSGSTVETLALYAIARAAVENAKLAVAAHFAFVTDPSGGPLREIATRDGIAAFAVPANVGGRFSVLTPVATLPAELTGVDTTALVAGAEAVRARCASPSLAANPAGRFAALQWRLHERAGQGTHVFMPYSDRLRYVGAWFAQLWGESLGKVDADREHAGPTPLAARGATDQHSLLQLLMEGPADKTVTFVTERSREADLFIPRRDDLVPGAPELRGQSLGALLDAERTATADALASVGRPSLEISIERCDAHGVGELLMLLMLATVYAGELYRVDPLGQPGVELGKRLAREALTKGMVVDSGAKNR